MSRLKIGMVVNLCVSSYPPDKSRTVMCTFNGSGEFRCPDERLEARNPRSATCVGGAAVFANVVGRSACFFEVTGLSEVPPPALNTASMYSSDGVAAGFVAYDAVGFGDAARVAGFTDVLGRPRVRNHLLL